MLIKYISDGQLNLEEFRLLTCALFRNDKGKIYHLDEEKLQEIFNVFDSNNDGSIDRDEFFFCWNHWIKIVSPSICRCCLFKFTCIHSYSKSN